MTQLSPLATSLAEIMQLYLALRWQDDEKPETKFRTEAELPSMREDLMQHSGCMNFMGSILLAEARILSDESVCEVNAELVALMAMLHDFDEVELTDFREKPSGHGAKVLTAKVRIMQRSFLQLRCGALLDQLWDDYLSRGTPTARFVKALDELQAWFYMLCIGTVEASRRDFHKPQGIEGYRLGQEFVPVADVMNELLPFMRQERSWELRVHCRTPGSLVAV